VLKTPDCALGNSQPSRPLLDRSPGHPHGFAGATQSVHKHDMPRDDRWINDRNELRQDAPPRQAGWVISQVQPNQSLTFAESDENCYTAFQLYPPVSSSRSSVDCRAVRHPRSLKATTTPTCRRRSRAGSKVVVLVRMTSRTPEDNIPPQARRSGRSLVRFACWIDTRKSGWYGI
jgi:hypothetical protein